jgi:hypothetical protein
MNLSLMNDMNRTEAANFNKKSYSRDKLEVVFRTALIFLFPQLWQQIFEYLNA